MSDRGLVAEVARFGRLLRARGVDVGLADAIDGVRALLLVDLFDPAEVRRALRIAFKVRRREWEQFDRAFDDSWMHAVRPRGTRNEAVRAQHGPASGDSGVPVSSRRPSQAPPPFSIESLPFSVAPPDPGGAADEWQSSGDHPGYSPALLLRKRPFDQCSFEDVQAMTRMLERHVLSFATRRARRLVPSIRTGMVDVRRSFRSSLATCGEPLVLARRAHPIEEARLVVLCDTSGSMDVHSRFLLAFVTALRRVVRRTEVFAFNTSLTRLTSWLVPGDVALTLERVTDGLAEWSGGTKIGESLSVFVRDHLDELVNRKTIVAIFSDGLDRGDTALVAEAMQAIHGKARRVIWLNPLAGDARYEPTARAMHAAMPFIDHLAPAHNLESLERVLSKLTTLSPARTGSRGFLS